jgi:hypothetical protein
VCYYYCYYYYHHHYHYHHHHHHICRLPLFFWWTVINCVLKVYVLVLCARYLRCFPQCNRTTHSLSQMWLFFVWLYLIKFGMFFSFVMWFLYVLTF